MSCLLMLYDMNCTDCNITRLSSTTMGKMMLGHNGVRGSRDYEERVADVESKQEYHPKHRKTYPLRKRMHGQPGNYSSPGIVQQLEETPADGVSPVQAIVEQWDYQGHQDQLQGEAPQAERSEDTGKENAKLDSVAPHAAESRPRRLASLNAEAVNNLLLEREDCPSNRRCRKGPSCGVECTENRPDCRTGYPTKRRIGSSSSSFDGDVFTCAGSEPTPAMDGWESGFAELPAKKRMASLNAAAFLKLSNTRDVSAGRRSRTDGESKPGKVTGGTRHSCPQPLAGRRCPRAKRKDFRSDIAAKLAPGTDLGDSEGQHKEVSASTGQHSTLPINADVPCPYMDKTNGYFHRLSMLMGSQAMIRPKYQALEESNASGAEFTQPVAPFQSHSLTLLDNFVSDPDHYEFLPPEVCLDSPVDDLYLHYDRSNLLPIGCNSTHGCPMCSAAFSCCMPPDDEGNLLISQSALPSGIPYSYAPCGGSLCVGDTTTVQCMGMNGYDLCRVHHPSLNRDVVRRTLTSDQASCLHELGTKADGYRSLKPLSVTIPVTSHPVSPANPVSGCPVPTAPPAAEPVPHLQRPGLETPATSRPQTLSMLKLSKECPQSSKPPSSSKSNLRSPASSPAQQSKAGAGHVESKQQRISRRRATNGWLPVGEPYDKPVYVVGEVELLIRKCYPAVERDGEVIKVRDTVLLKSGPRKKSIPYVAKVSALWEDPASGELMMSLYWYYRPEHIQGGRNPSIHCENEIFASRHQDENSVACIEEKCYVLTFSEYCRFCALAKWREEGAPDHRLVVPPSEEYSTPSHRKVPENTDPDLVFVCRHVYDFRHGRTLKNPQ
ncbi:bromo adjacent homology domain-containing 1 protein isoform X1 [Rhincodon typus]|uniref:bromo adjacent homology domain-containing 1 protein isoform X1 n=1 Tax=Rhincodon typus TaxID=259920 RepID=UPI00203049E5|nr:bromo adjacent homology domain-containing 1 protein isoform X1 [Rhincodon typus]XP_048456082.1 bromo adjacent homology domain-containing 1 protein isoform X1 [Rhincodon typus]XP_048456083.1 bromo adjacent homology domain-containing 1 protein isoform X1 [Rhincodon typus]